MIDKDLARRTAFNVTIAGIDITPELQPYFLDMTYSDNESDETDDLQIRVQDRDGIWREKWLNTAIHAAAGIEVDPTTDVGKYKVVAKNGVNIRVAPNLSSMIVGEYPYGTTVNVEKISDGWGRVTFSREKRYIQTAYLQMVEASEQTAGNTGGTSSAKADWKIGDKVTVSGAPQYSSYGEGTPGRAVTNYQGTITHINSKSGVPYPISVGSLGWFALDQVRADAPKAAAPPKEGRASTGLKVQAQIFRQNFNGDGKEDKLDCGQFELDSVTASGPPAVVTLKCTSLPFGTAVRQTQKSRSWENYNLKGVAEQIANQNGMTCMFNSQKNPTYKRMEQTMQSDIAFLKKLCNDAGCCLKATNNIIVVYDKSEYEKNPVIYTITPGCGYTKYSLKTGKNKTYDSCMVRYVTPSGTMYSGTAYVDGYKDDNEKNQRLTVSQRVSSDAEAQTLAKNLLKLNNQYEMTASFTFPGNPKFVACCTIQLKGYGAFDGKYVICKAKHSVSTSGYTTQIDLRKVG
ncbi:MAG: SH3 domain-containing protein [Clostridia bacterium]|nr:SH3 domain-containing protein [Clostridia bacterium]